MTAGGTVGLLATVLNDPTNAGVTWSCAPVGACGSFNPGQTGYHIDTLYTAPASGPSSAITLPITITATSVTDSTLSVSATVTVFVATPALLNGQYAIVLPPGNGGWGVAGSVTLDGQGDVLGGEVDWESPCCGTGNIPVIPTSTTGGSFYTLDATGHGTLSLDLEGDFQTHGITATSSSHLVIAEEDQFNGYTIGAVGSMDLQSAGPTFSGSQVAGGYSFTLSGYSGAMGANTSWGGIFTADGTATPTNSGNITGGIFDENAGNNGGGTGYNSATGAAGLSFTGTYTAPDANGRGIITLSSSPDTPGPCGASPLPACTQYAYYIVTPQVLRLVVITNAGNGGNSGSAFGQGSLATAANDTNAALSGGFVFSCFGFGDNNNGGDSSAAAGQFTTDGNGNLTGGIMDFNVADGGTPVPTIATTDISLAGSTYSISGSPRGTLTTPSGQIYNIYLTDPTLNLLDPNNTSGTGGALLLEADNPSAPYGNAIGVMIPQADAATATLAGTYAILLSNQSNLGCCSSDGGFSGDFIVSTTTPGTFSGEGDFQGTGTNNATLITGPLSGTFVADESNPGRFTSTIYTTPCFPLYVPDPKAPTPCGGAFNGSTEPPESLSFYLANSSQGFGVETDSTAPVFGVVELQVNSSPAGAAAKRRRANQQHSDPTNLPQTTGERHDRFSGHADSGHE
jgi:hypothetical protein